MTEISHLAPGADVASTAACLRGLGVEMDVPAASALRIHGRGLRALRAPDAPLDAGNSGTTIRLLAGVLATCPFQTTVVGDASPRGVPCAASSIRSWPWGPASPLRTAARRWSSRGPPGRPAGRAPSPAAQKSAILLAGLAARGVTSDVRALPTRDHTERAFPAFGCVGGHAGREYGVRDGDRPLLPRACSGSRRPVVGRGLGGGRRCLPGSSVELTASA